MTIVRRGNSWGVKVSRRGRSVWVGSYPDSRYGSRDDAFLAAKQAEIDAKRNATGSRDETCESFATRYPDDYNRSTRDGSPRWNSNTVYNMRGCLRPFVAAFGPLRLREVRPAAARKWAASQPLKYVAVARTMFNDAIADELADRNPFANLRLRHSRGRKDIVVLSEAEVEQLCELAEDCWPEWGQTFAALLATAAYTGIRPGELVALRWGDVDVPGQELRVRWAFNGREVKAPKYDQRRDIFLPPPAGARLAAVPRHLAPLRCPRCAGSGCEYCDAGSVRLVFQGPSASTILHRSTLYYYWNPVRIRFGRPGMDLYELRHFGATMLLERLIEAGVPDALELVAFQLGHRNTRLVEERYGHPSDVGRRERLKRAFGRNVAPLRVAGTGASEAADG